MAKEYGFAIKERTRNPNGYGALLGRVLDAICTDKAIPNRQPNGKPLTIGPRLERLASQEKLTKVEGAPGLRNVAAHADLGDLLPEDVPLLEALVRYILDHLYVIPAVNQKAIDSRQRRKKAGEATPSQAVTHQS